MCATVQGAYANGTPVNLAKCTNAGNQKFYEFQGGAIQLAGTNFCLDAGVNPSNGVQMKIWQCYFGLSQQNWNFLDGGLIQTANSESKCLHIGTELTLGRPMSRCQQPGQHSAPDLDLLGSRSAAAILSLNRMDI